MSTQNSHGNSLPTSQRVSSRDDEVIEEQQEGGDDVSKEEKHDDDCGKEEHQQEEKEQRQANESEGGDDTEEEEHQTDKNEGSNDDTVTTGSDSSVDFNKFVELQALLIAVKTLSSGEYLATSSLLAEIHSLVEKTIKCSEDMFTSVCNDNDYAHILHLSRPLAAEIVTKIKLKLEASADILFAQPKGSCYGDCPICFLPLPLQGSKRSVMSCCSHEICYGCFHADRLRQVSGSLQRLCPFCRHPVPTTQAESGANTMRRAEANDPTALNKVGTIHYSKGEYDRAFQYWSKAARLGNASAHFNVSILYQDGEGVEKDEKKFMHHLEEASIAGHPGARFNLGLHERKGCSKERAVKHFIIAANLGHDKSVKALKEGYAEGFVSKEDFATALRSYQTAVDAMKSPQRDAAYMQAGAEESHKVVR